MLRIHLLGQFKLTLHDQALDLPSRKTEALFAYLVCQARPLARETLATIFWDESSPEQAMANLRKVLSALRKQVADYLIVERQTVAFNTEPDFWLDTAVFGQYLAQPHPNSRLPTFTRYASRQEQLEQAAALYQGTFLAEMQLPDARDFEAWLTLERERLSYQYAEALRSLGHYYLQQRDYKAGIQAARQLLALDPLSETAHRQLILLLARNGQTETAVAHYHHCLQLLESELGVPPTAATVALFARIETAVSQPANLPELTSRFIGREEEIAHIQTLLSSHQCRLLTLLGPGGVGKTRLSLQLAADLAFDYLNGVTFVSCAAVESANGLITAVADALNLPLAGATLPQTQLLDFLQPRELLLVLDNCETLFLPEMDESAELVHEILQQAPQVTILATSRERFNFQIEHLYSLTGLAYPAPEALPQTAVQTPAVRLFVERAKEANVQFVLTPENLPDVTTICQLVAGTPLAIELAAGLTAQQNVAAVTAAIVADLDVLESESDTDKPDRHHSLRAVFRSSWAQLLPAEQVAFQRLTVFRGSFTAEAAIAVAEAHYLDLLGLVDKSFLQLTENGRYHIHEVLRHYAAEKLAENGERVTAVSQQHCHFYSQFMEAQGAALNSPQVGEGLNQLRLEIENCRQAWRWAVTHNIPGAIERSINGLARYYKLHGPFQEGVSQFGLGMIGMSDHLLSEPADKVTWQVLLARCQVQIAVFCNEMGAYQQAYDNTQIVLNMPDINTAVMAAAHLECGRSQVGQSRYDEAEQQLHTGLNLIANLPPNSDNQFLLAEGTRAQGVVSIYRGAYKAAKDYFETALKITQEAGNSWFESGLLNNLGIVAKNLGEFAAARVYYEQNLQLASQIGDRHGLSKTLINLGVVLRSLGHMAGARAAYEEALSLKREIGDRHGESLALNNLGNVAAQQGDFAGAQAFFEQALQIYRLLKRRRDEAMVLSNLGLLAHLLADEETAVSYSRQALTIACDIGDRPTEAFALLHLAHGLLATAQFEEAASLYQQAATLRQALGETTAALEAEVGLAQVRLAQGQPAAALALIDPILPQMFQDQVGSLEQPFRVYLTCYEVLLANGDGRAPEIISQAHTLLQKQAAQLENSSTREAFLNNVTAHRQIRHYFAGL